MIFQQVNIDDVAALQEAGKTCAEHQECIECPMVNGQVVNNIVCETGKDKK